MKLRTLAISCLFGATLALIALSVYGAWVWRDIDNHSQAVASLGEIRGRLSRLTAAIDYSTLLRADPAVVSATVEDARQLAGQVAVFDHPQADRASAHLVELAYVGEHVLGYLERVGAEQVAPSAEMLLTLSQQIRIHHSAANDALNLLLDARREHMSASRNAVMTTLVATILLFALLVVLAFSQIFRRISGPTRAIDEALMAMAAGDFDTRLKIEGEDELAELAGSFNTMASQLNERIKELRCLYQVLEITADKEGQLDEVAESVASLLAASMRYPERAMARVVMGNVEGVSGVWPKKVDDRLSAAIVVDSRLEGRVEVAYQVNAHECHFLEEERELVDGVAVHLGKMLHGRRLGEALTQGERLRAIGELTGGIAHDFNNLLTVILGNAEFLREQLAGLRGDQVELAGMIIDAADRGSQLTQRLLAFARRQPLAPRSVDVNQLVAGMEPLLRRSLGEHIEIELVRGAGLWRARIDPGQLENALLNLAINGRDAMSGGGKLTIETANMWLNQDYADQHQEVTPGQYVMVAVSDTGTGIPKELLSRVFEPFFTTKESGKGTGLGLSMVYGFIKQSGGHIKVYSEAEQGSTIRMYLPREFRDQDELVVEPALEVMASGDGLILLVEDDELVRRIARRQLLSMGYQVLEAANGRDALTIIEQREDIDLLFTDVVMPGEMNGRELADAALRLRPGLRVLYTSGYTQNAIVHHGRLDPGVEFISKPYRRAELARRLRQIFEK